MQILLLKLIGLLGLFTLMLAGVLLPVRLLLVDRGKVEKYSRALSLCNSFAGGVFLATCFNALLPAVRQKVLQLSSSLHLSSDFPLAETVMMFGFFLTVFVEQSVLTFRKEPPSFIHLDTFGADACSEVGSDSENETPFISPSRGVAVGGGVCGHRSYGPLGGAQLSGAGPMRLASLVLALSAHSVFEGLALGLQEDRTKLGGLFLGVAMHQTLAGVALGVSAAKSSLGLGNSTKLGVAVSLMIPLGAVVGITVQSVETLAGGVASLLLQGLAAGTFLFVLFFEILSKELEQNQDRLLKVFFLVLGYSTLAMLLIFIHG